MLIKLGKKAVFGLQFYGECWSGQNAELKYNNYGEARPEKCIMNLYQPNECVQSSNQECVGGSLANYVDNLAERKLNVVKDKPVISRILKMSMFLCREKSFTFSVSLGLFTVGAFESIKNFD